MCLLYLFIWIIVARICVGFFTKKGISLYYSKIIMILFPVYWLIIDLFKSFFLHTKYSSKYVCGYFARSDFLIYLWTDFFLTFSSMIDILHALVCMLFCFILKYYSSKLHENGKIWNKKRGSYEAVLSFLVNPWLTTYISFFLLLIFCAGWVSTN